MAELDQGNAKDTLMGVLGYIDSPFKLGVVVLLAFLAFAGYFVYNNQELLIGAYQKQQEAPKLVLGRSEDAAKVIFKETGADMVVIFSVDQILGKRIVERAYLKDGGREKAIEGLDVGLFSTNSANNTDIIRLMSAEIPCGSYTRAQSEVGVWYLQQGITFTCRVSVPPDIYGYIGQITVGWKDPPNYLDKSIDMMALASHMLVKKR